MFTGINLCFWCKTDFLRRRKTSSYCEIDLVIAIDHANQIVVGLLHVDARFFSAADFIQNDLQQRPVHDFLFSVSLQEVNRWLIVCCLGVFRQRGQRINALLVIAYRLLKQIFQRGKFTAPACCSCNTGVAPLCLMYSYMRIICVTVFCAWWRKNSAVPLRLFSLHLWLSWRYKFEV